MLSPTIFLIVTEWIMRRTTSITKTDVQWTFAIQLKNVDFADNIKCICLVFNTILYGVRHIQIFTQRIKAIWNLLEQALKGDCSVFLSRLGSKSQLLQLLYELVSSF